MQEDLEKIFELAKEEVPTRYFTLYQHEAVMYRGFKISKWKDKYKWQDTRYSDFYEKVDPVITKTILKDGFKETLRQVMIHSDKERMLLLAREIEEAESLIKYWSRQSVVAWNNYDKKKKNVDKDKKTTNVTKRKKKDNLYNKYIKKKNLFQKKRDVLSEEKGNLAQDLNFFRVRIKMYN